MSPRQKQTPMVSETEVFERFSSLKSKTSRDGWKHAGAQFPIRITRSWYNRIQSPDDPIAKQVFPQPSEFVASPTGLVNPVGEHDKMPVPFVVQKHSNRLLLLVSRKCHLHCRYCFRRTLDDLVEPTKEELDIAIDYILRSGVEEVILSGGDPLFLNDERLGAILERLKDIPTLRIHTRAPITYPSRIQPRLVLALKKHPNVWVIVHCNHPDEINEEVMVGLSLLKSSGVPLLNQSVLLRGVNDNAAILAELSRVLVRQGVFPYYLHHTDRVQGAEDFYVSAEDGLKIVHELETLVSGMALPKYIVDLPDGSGKIPVERWVFKQG